MCRSLLFGQSDYFLCAGLYFTTASNPARNSFEFFKNEELFGATLLVDAVLRLQCFLTSQGNHNYCFIRSFSLRCGWDRFFIATRK